MEKKEVESVYMTEGAKNESNVDVKEYRKVWRIERKLLNWMIIEKRIKNGWNLKVKTKYSDSAEKSGSEKNEWVSERKRERGVFSNRSSSSKSEQMTKRQNLKIKSFLGLRSFQHLAYANGQTVINRKEDSCMRYAWFCVCVSARVFMHLYI